jgi:hypothetical protein
MAECKCGFTTDPDKSCNGTHKVVKSVKEQIIKDLESFEIKHENALGMKTIAIKIVKDSSGC